MADIVLTINGIGHGHLMRGLNLCRWLRRSGRRPLVIHQGRYFETMARRYPGVSMPTVYKQTPEAKEEIRHRIIAAARLSKSSLVIEDTHPVELDFPEDVARLLVVRPTVIEHMRMLRNDYFATYARFLICDHPDSPTWPYSEDETEEILSWERFECMGPIHRRPIKKGIDSVRLRYALDAGQPMLVFSLGGGGEKAESGDREQFLTFAARIAEEYRMLKPNARYLFVCGPLFPEQLAIPEIFERVQQEPEFPSLLACATGAVIRPGYNAMWECIAAGTPFLPRLGTTYMEPSDLRLKAMTRAGMRLPCTVEELADDDARESFAATCRKVTERFSGSPSPRFLEVVEEIAPVRRAAMPGGMVRPKKHASAVASTARIVEDSHPRDRLTILLDGVTNEEEHLAWLASLSQERDFQLSLAIIPYLSKLSSTFLDEIDPQEWISVAMQGFCNLQREPNAEFTEGSEAEVGLQRWQLLEGFRLLRLRFRKRFRGGFVAPFDSLPTWLPDEWKTIGGRYLCTDVKAAEMFRSVVVPVLGFASLPYLGDTSTPPEQLLRSLRGGECRGLTINPHLLETSSGRSTLTRLLDAIAAALAKTSLQDSRSTIGLMDT